MITRKGNIRMDEVDEGLQNLIEKEKQREKAMKALPGYEKFLSDEAHKLAEWAMDVWLEEGDRLKAVKLKRMANRMEDRRRERVCWFSKKFFWHEMNRMGSDFKNWYKMG